MSKANYVQHLNGSDFWSNETHERPEKNRYLVNAERKPRTTADLLKRAILRPDRLLPVLRCVAGLSAILLATAVFRDGTEAKATTAGFTYLLIILIASKFLDSSSLLLMSVTATLSFDYYFLQPIGTFNVTDPRDWIALFSFLVTAIIGSHLSTQARERAKEASRKSQELRRLYDFSQQLLEIADPMHMFDEIAVLTAKSFMTGRVALYICEQDEVFHSSEPIYGLGADQFREIVRGVAREEHTDSLTFKKLHMGVRVTGCIGIAAPVPSKETVEAIASLIAIAIDRCRAMQKINAIEAARERERFKSVLLDAITHDFRTPLTSIKVSATGLLEDEEFGREQRRELLSIIDEECDRISQLVGEACELARLESGDIHLELSSHPLESLVAASLHECKAVIESRPIDIDIPQKDLSIVADFALAKKVLIHLVMNAHLYSTPGCPIGIKAESHGAFNFVSVSDSGTGIAHEEITQIFEKFYRGRDQRMRVHGTGMGLPIAKAIVEAHGGTIDVSSRAGRGSTFTFSLPAQRPAHP